ncbi:MAG: ribonuclease PH [Phycisphaerae bacterium]
MAKRRIRSEGRRAADLRKVEIVRGFTKFAPGSVLIKWGDTQVLCTAFVENGVPRWKEGRGTGWVTAEYEMLPSSTPQRRRRNRTRVDGRSQEIQRLIGRSLRSIVDMRALGERSIFVDCDVLQADGGTRAAAITGAYVALCDAVRFLKREKLIQSSPLIDSIAAVSVGTVDGHILLDLDYDEDSTADVDFNVAMTGTGQFVEIQGTGESATFSRAQLDRMLRLAARGIKQLNEYQQRALRKRI